MNFFDYLVCEYGYNEPIFLSEIFYNNYSLSWIKKEINKLCQTEKLIRFEKGLYYIPTQTILGMSKLDPRKVIMKKYIKDGNEQIGYFSGTTFLNMLGLSTQMPNVLEIYTNNENARVREVPIGSQRVVLRRARAPINSKNASTMSFLELMNFTDAKYFDDEKKQIIIDFINQNNITRNSLTECSPFFPDKAMRTLIESELIYNVAQ
jgi:hypothetical protein